MCANSESLYFKFDFLLIKFNYLLLICTVPKINKYFSSAIAQLWPCFQMWLTDNVAVFSELLLRTSVRVAGHISSCHILPKTIHHERYEEQSHGCVSSIKLMKIVFWHFADQVPWFYCSSWNHKCTQSIEVGSFGEILLCQIYVPEFVQKVFCATSCVTQTRCSWTSWGCFHSDCVFQEHHREKWCFLYRMHHVTPSRNCSGPFKNHKCHCSGYIEILFFRVDVVDGIVVYIESYVGSIYCGLCRIGL